MRKYQNVARQLTVVERRASSDPRMRRLLAAAPLVVLFALLNARPVRAACTLSASPDPTVDGSSDSLRAAIQTANASTEDCVINLAAETYTLTIKNTNGQDNTAAEGDLDITAAGHTVTVQGAGSRVSIVNGNGIDRVFQVLDGANAVFSGLTIEGGVAQDDGTADAAPGSTESEGGGILVQGGGHVTLSRVSLTNNQAIGGPGAAGFAIGNNTIGQPAGPGQPAAGGGLYLSAGVVTLTNSKISGSTATGGGGGIGASVGSPCCNVGSLSGGTGGASAGGGLYILSGRVEASKSTLSGNNATGGPGGAAGISFISGNPFEFGHSGTGGVAQGAGVVVASGNVTVGQTTVSGNLATGGEGGTGENCDTYRHAPAGGGSSLGAGLFVTGGNLSLANSTLFANTAKGGSRGSVVNSATSCSQFPQRGGAAAGGGLYASSGSITLKGVTVASNQALAIAAKGPSGSSSGGGIANAGATSLLVNTTLIGDNTQDSGNARNGADVSGAITASFSLIGQSAGATITGNGHNLLDVSPALDPNGLQSNGGPTQTVALENGSPALGAGDNGICAKAPPKGLGGIDQRGFARADTSSDSCDIGAFEVQTP